MNNRKQVFSIRKLKIGVCSVLLCGLLVSSPSFSYLPTNYLYAQGVDSEADEAAIFDQNKAAKVRQALNEYEAEMVTFLEKYDKARRDEEIFQEFGTLEAYTTYAKNEEELALIINSAKMVLDEYKMVYLYEDFEKRIAEREVDFLANEAKYAEDAKVSYNTKKADAYKEVEKIRERKAATRGINADIIGNLEAALRGRSAEKLKLAQ